MRYKNKRGAITLSDAPALIITLVVLGIVTSLGVTILFDMWDLVDTTGVNTTPNYAALCSHSNYTCTSASANASENAIEAVTNFSDLLPIIGLVIAIVIVLGVIFMLWQPGGRGGT